MGKHSFFGILRGRTQTVLAAAILSAISAPLAPAHSAELLNRSPDEFAAMAHAVQDSYDQIARSIAPSVVSISVAIDATGADDTVRPDDMTARKLSGLLSKTTRTVGTGAVLSADGLILTNEHVVCEAKQIWVTTDAGKVYPAFVVATDPRQDLAILRMPAAPGIKPVTMAPAESVSRGHFAIALGNPYGLATEGKLAMSVGTISALGRTLTDLSRSQGRNYSDLIQTTAEINPGNSGGPLFDIDGRMIGIITAVILPNKNNREMSGIGFAFPLSPQILSRINALKVGQDIAYGDPGFSASALTARQRRAAGITGEMGVRLETIDPNGPSASLRDGDILLSIDGNATNEIDDYTRVATAIRAGVPAKLIFSRGGKLFTTTITPRRKASLAASRSPSASASQTLLWKGMLLGPIPANWEFPGARPDSGLMVLASDPAADTSALPVGTIIQSVGSHTLNSVAELQDTLASLPPEKCQLSLWSPAVNTANAAVTVSDR